MQNVRMFGTVCASVTPMTENEKVDYDSVKPLVAYMQQIGVNGLYPIGTTGESMVLERKERVRLAHAFADANAGKTPLCTSYPHRFQTAPCTYFQYPKANIRSPLSQALLESFLQTAPPIFQALRRREISDPA